MLQKIYISNKCCSLEYSTQRILKKCITISTKNCKQHILILRNVSWAKNQHIINLKDHVTLKTGVMTAKNTALPLQE